MTTRTDSITFDYERFCTLETGDLVQYMEPLLADKTALVGAVDLERLAASLHGFDEYHLVYAIELGMDRSPELFRLPVARCLSHERQSVRLAAHRQLLWLPPEMIADDLMQACDRALQASEKWDDVSDIVERLRQRRRIQA